MRSSRVTSSGAASSEEEAVGPVGMAHADMAVGVEHLLVGEDAVGDDKIAQPVVELAHAALPAGFAGTQGEARDSAKALPRSIALKAERRRIAASPFIFAT